MTRLEAISPTAVDPEGNAETNRGGWFFYAGFNGRWCFTSGTACETPPPSCTANR